LSKRKIKGDKPISEILQIYNQYRTFSKLKLNFFYICYATKISEMMKRIATTYAILICLSSKCFVLIQHLSLRTKTSGIF